VTFLVAAIVGWDGPNALVEDKEKWYGALIAAGCTGLLVWGLLE